jgi:hypothetical protein
MKQEVFYNVDKMEMDEIIAMLRDCRELSYTWWADKLDCAESWARQKIDCSFDEILARISPHTHFVVIDRGSWGGDREHFEVGFRTMGSAADYFLFIEVESEKMPPILKKYRLAPITC